MIIYLLLFNFDKKKFTQTNLKICKNNSTVESIKLYFISNY